MTKVEKRIQFHIDTHYESPDRPEMDRFQFLEWIRTFNDCQEVTQEQSDKVFYMYTIGPILF